MHTFLSRRKLWGTYFLEGGLWLMLVGLCISRAAMSLGMGISILGALFQWDGPYIWRAIRNRKWLWGAWLVGVWHLLSLIPGDTRSASLAYGDWVPFLLLITALGTLPRIPAPQWYRLMKVYVLGVGATALLMVLLAAGKALQTGIWSAEAFSYVSLTQPIGHHPTYFGLLVNLCLPALYSLYHRPGVAKRSILMYALAMAGLGLFQGLLAARMQMLIFVLLLIGLAFKYLRQRNRTVLILASLSGVMLGYLIWQQPFVQQRMQDLRYSEWQTADIQEISWNGVAVRLYLWEKSWDQIKLHPWNGVGLGGAPLALDNSFQQDQFPNPEMNSHNQYLHTMLELGVPGLALLLGWWGIPMFFPEKGRQWIFLPIALIFLASGLTEVIFARQWGLLSAILFMTLSLAHAPRGTGEVVKTGSRP